jgi:hypothetical protein
LAFVAFRFTRRDSDVLADAETGEIRKDATISNASRNPQRNSRVDLCLLMIVNIAPRNISPDSAPLPRNKAYILNYHIAKKGVGLVSGDLRLT